MTDTTPSQDSYFPVKSRFPWGATIVSIIVLLTFGAALIAVLSKTLPAGSEAVANIMLGTLGGMAVTVVSYWVGSSASSSRKDTLLANSMPPKSSGDSNNN